MHDRTFAPPSTDLARDLRALHELTEMRKRLIAERDAAIDAQCTTEWRSDARDLFRLANTLASMVSELRRERDSLKDALDEQARAGDLHEKLEDLASFAEAFNLDDAPPARYAPAPRPAREMERSTRRQPATGARRADRMAWALRS